MQASMLGLDAASIAHDALCALGMPVGRLGYDICRHVFTFVRLSSKSGTVPIGMVPLHHLNSPESPVRRVFLSLTANP